MRIGLIGAGRIGAVHATTLATLPQVDDVVVCDIDEDRARQLADAHGSTTTPTVDTLWRGVDGVVIGAPTSAARGAAALAPQRPEPRRSARSRSPPTWPAHWP